MGLVYLRPSSLLRLTELPGPDDPWAIVGMRDGLRLIGQAPGGGVTMQRIDPITGEAGPLREMSPQPVMTGRIVHRPLLFALALTALMVVILFRPSARTGDVSLPSGVVVPGVVPRLIAVAIDLAVGAAVAVVMLGCSLRDLAELPLWTPDLTDAVPFLVMAGVTMLHSTVSELIWKRTLGKTFVGARVVARDGTPPTATAILIRNALKALVLLIPVLALLALLNPHLQGLGDSIARTVVVRDARESPDDAPKDR